MTALLQGYATAQAHRAPNDVALVMGDDRVTYGALEVSSNRIARVLREAGCTRGDRVCLFLPKSATAIACMLGTLKADCIYVPIDVASPAARLEKIVRSADPRVILVTASTAPLLDELCRLFSDGRTFRVASVDDTLIEREHFRSIFARPDWETQSAEPLPSLSSAADAAHILFTSGSTGAPKGVVITHATVIHFVEWALSYFGTTATDRISGHPPLHFDLSLFDIFGTFSRGAELHLVPPSLNLSAAGMAQFIRSRNLTQWFSVPSALNYMAKFDAVRQKDFPALKRVLWCGEVLPTATLRYWMERLPGVQFTNLYGPTEAAIASSYYTLPSIPEPNESIPIGRPCEGESLVILDDTLRPVSPGTLGQLYIGGVGLSPGYWKDEQKTRASFLDSPDGKGRIYKTGDLAKVGIDGLIYFAGRADGQIKSRGYRIELGEIEAALNCIENLKESAVVAIPTSEFEGSLICCAFAPLEGAHVTIITLREALRRTLPHYMLPGRWLSLDRLPKNTNGKIDRPILKELFRSNADAATQRCSSEVQSIEV